MSDALPPYEFALPGPLRERLCGLVLAGVKTGTFTLQVLDEMWPDAVLPLGSLAQLVSSAGTSLAVLEVVSRQRLPIAEVTWDMVASEGEGDESVEEWRDGHESFWAQFVEEICAHTGDSTWQITDSTIVVYETFRVVQRLAPADEGRYAVVELAVPEGEVDVAVSELSDLDTVGIEELSVERLTSTNRFGDAAGLVALRAGFASEVIAARAESALPRRWLPRLEVIVGDDWLDTWREHVEPVRVGRVVIAPQWRRDDDAVRRSPLVTEAGDDDLVLWLEPGRSFGSGGHASTRLALLALQDLDLHDCHLLDVGCGSGILAVAAAMLGARSAEGVDVEPGALRALTDNAARNGVGDRCAATRSDVSDVVGRSFDVVVANILAPVLIDLADEISARIGPGGSLVLAGLIDDQVERVVAAYPTLVLERDRCEGNWVALTLRSP